MVDGAATILAISAICLASFGVGRLITRLVPLCESNLIETIAWSFGFGFALNGGLILTLGRLAWLDARAICVATLLTSCWGIAEAICLCASPSRCAELDAGREDPSADATLDRRPYLLAAAVLLLVLPSALAPCCSERALSLNLEYAKQLTLGIHANGVAPSLFDGLAAWAMMLDGPFAAGLLQWALAASLALASSVLAAPILGPRRAGWAAVIVTLMPGVHYQCRAPVEDLLLALFLTLTTAAWWKAVIDHVHDGWIYVAICMAAAAALTHPIAWAGLLPLAALGIVLRRPAACSYILRTFVYVLLAIAVGIALGLAPSRLPCLLQQVKHLGPIPWLLMPALLISRRLRGLSTLGQLTCCALIVSLAGFNARHAWALGLGGASVVAAWAFLELGQLAPRVRWLLQACAAVASFVVCAEILAKSWHALPVAMGTESREEFLVRRDAALGAVLRAGRMITTESCVLSDEPRTAYLPCKVICSADRAFLDSNSHPKPTHALVSVRPHSKASQHVLANWVRNGSSQSLVLLDEQLCRGKLGEPVKLRFYLVRF